MIDLSMISDQAFIDLCAMACAKATEYIHTPEGKAEYEKWLKEHEPKPIASNS